nr:hypothetical protein [Gemmatimonadaceae bacterium]
MTPARGTALALLLAATAAHGQSFEVGRASVTQGRFGARVPHPDTIISTYPRAAREVRFKFAIGGRDNEFAPGIEH